MVAKPMGCAAESARMAAPPLPSGPHPAIRTMLKTGPRWDLCRFRLSCPLYACERK